MADRDFAGLGRVEREVLSFGALATSADAREAGGSMAAAMARLARLLKRSMPDRAAARSHTRIRDWLLVHAFLPAVCDPDILEETLRHNAPLYGRVRPQLAAGARPLEFDAVAWLLSGFRPRDPFEPDVMAQLGDTQGCLDALDFQGIPLRRLSPTALCKGPAGAIARREDLIHAAPLPFYLGIESEAFGHGAQLGPLGSLILAETLAGEIIHNRGSFWHAPGSDGGRWHPRDDVFPAGEPIDSLAALLRAARPT